MTPISRGSLCFCWMFQLHHPVHCVFACSSITLFTVFAGMFQLHHPVHCVFAFSSITLFTFISQYVVPMVIIAIAYGQIVR